MSSRNVFKNNLNTSVIILIKIFDFHSLSNVKIFSEYNIILCGLVIYLNDF